MAIFLAIALSLDALGMGITCGLRRLHLGLGVYIVLFFVSMAVMASAVFFGNFIAGFLSPDLAELIAAIWIMCIGAWIVLSELIKKQENTNIPKKVTKLAAFQIALVLSLDSIGAGIAAASLGISIYFLPILVAGFQISFLYIGVKTAGAITKKFTNQRIWAVVAGLILITVGIMGLAAN